MKKKIILISLCCSCILQAGWYDDAKAKANVAYDSTKNSINTTVDSAKNKYEDYNDKKNIKKQQEVDKCIKDIKSDLLRYGLFLENHYMGVNSQNEQKVINSYSKLKKKGISKQLQSAMDEETIKKLSNSKSTLEYTSSIISALKIIQKELKKNNKENLDNLIQQTQFLMFAWTVPMELLSTQSIYNESLIGLSESLYKNINRDNYDNYSRFIYSLLYVNLVNENIVVKKDTTTDVLIKAGLWMHTPWTSFNSEDKAGQEAVCKDLLDDTFTKKPQELILENFALTLAIDKDKLAKKLDTISDENNLFKSSVLFNKHITDLKEVSIIDNPLNDSWYMMIREYMELQDEFYKTKKEIEKIIKILVVLPNTENKIATLKQNLFEVDALYRKLDEVVRYNIIDLPISIYADLYHVEFQKGKKWYNDDEKAMSDIAVAYNKSCANMQKYMASEYTVEKVMKVTKALKSEFDEETEWKEVKTRAKLTQDWFNMLNKIEIKNK